VILIESDERVMLAIDWNLDPVDRSVVLS
jgi:hypothetical protein